MLNHKQWQAAAAVILTLGSQTIAVTSMIAPIVAPAPAVAQGMSFNDVPSGYWAEDFIQSLVTRGVIAGFPDGTFRPNEPVTRAQFSAMVRKAFGNNPKVRNVVTFVDVPTTYWANSAIDNAYETGFLAGYPGNVFRPEQNIPREQVLVSLANGLNYSPTAPVDNILNYYQDANNISNFARSPIAAATENKMVVNYANLSVLNPARNATRAEVAAFLYQALVREGVASAINSPYIVSPTPVATEYKIPAGTVLPVSYAQDKILLMPEETLPVTLTVRSNITTRDGKLLIPANSQVKGKLQPAPNGSQFVAEQIIFPDGTTQTINAASQVITKKETIRRGINVDTIVKGAALGTAAAAAISAVTGDRAVATEELLLGAGAGALAGLIQTFLGRSSVDLVVVEPETNLNLTLQSDFVAKPR